MQKKLNKLGSKQKRVEEICRNETDMQHQERLLADEQRHNLSRK